MIGRVLAVAGLAVVAIAAYRAMWRLLYRGYPEAMAYV